MSHKYQVGQLVKVIKANNYPENIGAVGCVLAQPDTVDRINGLKTLKGAYTVEFPGYYGPSELNSSNCLWGCFEEQLAPIDDPGNRTKAEKDELVFKGLMIF